MRDEDGDKGDLSPLSPLLSQRRCRFRLWIHVAVNCRVVAPRRATNPKERHPIVSVCLSVFYTLLPLFAEWRIGSGHLADTLAISHSYCIFKWANRERASLGGTAQRVEELKTYTWYLFLISGSRYKENNWFQQHIFICSRQHQISQGVTVK